MSKAEKKHITEWRVIAMSGATVDGREITEKHIKEMAEQYNPEIYGARINLEHLRFIFPYPEVSGFGDVEELKAEKRGGKYALLAKLSVSENLQSLWNANSKVYSSIEYAEKFADTGKAYLMGLAVTDTPASLSTSRHFSVTGIAAVAAAQSINLSEYTEMTQKHNHPAATEKPGLFSALLAKFAAPVQEEEKVEEEKPMEVQPEEGQAEMQKLSDELKQAQVELKASAEFGSKLLEKVNKLEADLNTFRREVENTPADGQRQPHAGNGESDQIDW